MAPPDHFFDRSTAEKRVLAGPIVTRELTTDPRKVKHFGLRAGYAAALCVLVFTCSQSTFSGTIPRSLGDISQFSVFVFNLIWHDSTTRGDRGLARLLGGKHFTGKRPSNVDSVADDRFAKFRVGDR